MTSGGMLDDPGSDAVLERLGRLHPKQIDLSLDRMRRILAALGNPERSLPPVVHVAGTNGKGSTIAFLRAMLEAGGYRVHCYTSPNLVRFHERIRLAGAAGGPGAAIPEAALLSVLEECEMANGGAPITYFEITTAAAFLAFARQAADVLLLEVGLGGRLDSTNVVESPMLTVITPVSMDHMSFLGDTLAAIAGEKAGILKPSVPCVVAPQQTEAMRAIAERAAALGAPFIVAGEDWVVRGHGRDAEFAYGTDRVSLGRLGLAGGHQPVNAGTALACLRHMPGFSVSGRAELAGLRDVDWPGRLQRLVNGPLVDQLPISWGLWLDGGHNAAAGAALAEVATAWAIEVPDQPLLLVYGMLNTKQAHDFLEPLAAHAAKLIAVPIPGAPASLSSEEAAAAALGAGHIAEAASDVGSALARLRDLVPPEQPARVLICGSLYLAGAVLRENG